MGIEDVKLDRPDPNRQCAPNGSDNLSNLVECISRDEEGVKLTQHVVDRFDSVNGAKPANGPNVVEVLWCDGTIGGKSGFEIALIQ